MIKQLKEFRNYNITLIGILLFCLVSCSDKTKVASPTKIVVKDSLVDNRLKNLDIYLAIGQSNMAGRASIRPEDSVAIDRASLFTGDNEEPWIEARNPLNLYSTVRKVIRMQRLGPAYSFSKSMTSAFPDNEIGLVVNARGGTKIVQWLPGTQLYEAAIAQTKKALEYGTLKGIIWHQGEGDADPLRTGMYLGRLEILVNALREEFDDPKLPFIAGQLLESEKRRPFNEMLLKLPEFIRNSGVATSEGTTSFDGTHFDSASAILLGNRHADEMIKLLNKQKP